MESSNVVSIRTSKSKEGMKQVLGLNSFAVLQLQKKLLILVTFVV